MNQRVRACLMCSQPFIFFTAFFVFGVFRVSVSRM